jgi:hypothetical protein
MREFPIIIVIIIVILIIRGIIKFFTWLGKMAEGGQPPNVQLPEGQDLGEVAAEPEPALPDHIRAFLERARREHAGRPQRPAPPPEPAVVPARTVPDQDVSERFISSMKSEPAREPRARRTRRGRARPPRRRQRTPETDEPVRRAVRTVMKPTHDTLRKAVIWSEILRKPVSIRRRGGGHTAPFRDTLP